MHLFQLAISSSANHWIHLALSNLINYETFRFYPCMEAIMKAECMIRQWDSQGLVVNSTPWSRETIYGKADRQAGKALHSWGVTQPGGVGTIVGRGSAQQQLRDYFVHSGPSDRRSLLRSTKFISTAASGPITARCSKPETVRRGLERFCSLSHGYQLPSLFLTCCNDPFFVPLLRSPSMFSFCLSRLLSHSLNLGFCSK